eukprot:m.246099 g.246099  ORF g.246099 m.246099 type:complete len:60 (+) comp41138_c0_seq1:203-382(+)
MLLRFPFPFLFLEKFLASIQTSFSLVKNCSFLFSFFSHFLFLTQPSLCLLSDPALLQVL